MSDDPYVYPGTGTLINRLGIEDGPTLDRAERRLVALRMVENVPGGAFDLAHLRAIHRHLFQDVYDWAGELRIVEIAKGGSQFQFRRYIEIGMADVHRRVVAADGLRGLSRQDFAARAGAIIGDVNYVHPFRDGNGRAQLQYLKQLAECAGHDLDLSRLRPDAWLAASRAAHRGDHALMAGAIAGCIVGV